MARKKLNNFTGLILDPRSKKEKAKDWTSAELLAGTPEVEWEKKTKWNTYTPRNQASTSSCVAQSIAKMFEVMNKYETGNSIVFSASPIYAKRANYPSPGMWLQNALEIAVKYATTLEKRIPSQNLSSDSELEEEAKKWNDVDDEYSKTFASGSYAQVRIDMDEIAYFVSQGRPVVIIVFADPKEYKLKPVIKDPNLTINQASIRHAITVVDYGINDDDERVLKCEDSAWFSGVNERFITEEFLKFRCYGAGVLFDLPNEKTPSPTLPESDFSFEKTLKYGMYGDRGVMALQDLLKRLGFFPKSIESTGNYLQITAKAVLDFQKYYKVASSWELYFLGGKVVGPKTRKKLNELI